MTVKDNFFKGFIKENPLLVSVLGLCPALAVTTKIENAIGMGFAVLFVLVLSNLLVSLVTFRPKLRELVMPVRIPVYIVLIASLVVIVEMLMKAFLPELFQSLGLFIPLIVVNCIIFGRAEAYAGDHKPGESVIDGAGMAIGFTLAIILISLIREVLGAGQITIWKSAVLDLSFLFDFLGIEPIAMFMKPEGAFITLGFILAAVAAIQNRVNAKKNAKKAEGGAK
ncbi:MAG: electron transport complex subunit RsxE [Candidatus Izemoplasmatales bacterium]|jgi:electron transport complex protein RnfE|nr:electron transport complex subunit RsxE [Candidatus Izemoplasmatales bacterium]NLF48629.1 electron transport complex subunit RsxE [Acholeplasmataceae bacterium]MDD4354714.1 electron transport complex subunit RsxE [Candidatus Izemoplasmatales bacterium]MDD4987593.1 electron transport complex subunit RsxE [Candidatus Izemoplasmatales bacterium]MDD5602264.1 electron transport complex subunit RsxE [Candidatus Izemoplasmatales bacterium]